MLAIATSERLAERSSPHPSTRCGMLDYDGTHSNTPYR